LREESATNENSPSKIEGEIFQKAVIRVTKSLNMREKHLPE